MSIPEKKKKRKNGQTQGTQTEELAGSANYLANREIDQIIKRGKDRLKHAISVADEKLARTKKEEAVREMALDMENAHYPVNQICEKLAKSLKGLVRERTVREALDTKYKNTEQMTVALQQNHDGILYRQQEQLKNKDIKDYTLDDIQAASPTQLRNVAKHLMQRADWWEQQTKQAKDLIVTARQLFEAVQNEKLSNEDAGRMVREAGKSIVKALSY